MYNILIIFNHLIMNIITKILKNNWYTKEQLKQYEKDWICNWAWWKWGIDFDSLLKSLPYFRKSKWKKLLEDFNYISDIHDIAFYNWWWYSDFIRVNYKLSINTFKLLYWTNIIHRVFIFILLFVMTTLFWKKYFNN